MTRCSGYEWRLMWRDISIVVADLSGSKYSHRKIAKLLHVPHADFIDEKIAAKAARQES